MKAFDTVSHEAIITSMKDAYPGNRMLNFIKSFLHHRTFEVRTGRPNPQTYTNNIGVPQGSVISPVLFNVVMRSIATALEEESTIHFTFYAGDITIWTESDDYESTERACEELQNALLIIERAIARTGMQVSPEKTQFLTVGGSSTEQAKVALTLQGRPLKQPTAGWIRILGVPISTKGGADVWLQQLTPTWKKTLHLIKRISNKFGGATQDIARILVQSTLISKACYGGINFHLTQAQAQKIESLYLQALRVVTGLPHHTHAEELYRYSKLPRLNEIIAQRARNDNARRLFTAQGHRLLKHDNRIFRPGHFEVTIPPWEDTIVTAHWPLPSKVNTTAHVHQRTTQAQAALPFQNEERTIYVDGAIREDRRLIAVAVTDTLGTACTERDHDRGDLYN